MIYVLSAVEGREFMQITSPYANPSLLIRIADFSPILAKNAD